MVLGEKHGTNYLPYTKSQVDNNGLTVAEVTKKNSNRDTLRYDLCCCQDNHFCLLQDNSVCPVTCRLFKLLGREIYLAVS